MTTLASEALQKLSSLGLGEKDIGEIMILFDTNGATTEN
jgi:hypothetical protein